MRVKVSETDIAALNAAKLKIETALDALTKAEQAHAAAGQRTAELERKLIAGLAEVDPSDDAAVDAVAVLRGRLDTLRSWLTRAAPTRAAIAELTASVLAAKPIIQATAQARSVEESAIHACSWQAVIENLGQSDLSNQTRLVRHTGQEVVGDIQRLLSAKIGGLLTGDERRAGVLFDGGNKRALTIEELRLGYSLD
jgi:hypothetical protein